MTLEEIRDEFDNAILLGIEAAIRRENWENTDFDSEICLVGEFILGVIESSVEFHLQKRKEPLIVDGKELTEAEIGQLEKEAVERWTQPLSLLLELVHKTKKPTPMMIGTGLE